MIFLKVEVGDGPESTLHDAVVVNISGALELSKKLNVGILIDWRSSSEAPFYVHPKTNLGSAVFEVENYIKSHPFEKRREWNY